LPQIQESRRLDWPGHRKQIFASKVATAKECLAVQTEGKRQVQRSILHYNLDAIIAVGYRPNDLSQSP
jgi:hypothetical protein